VVHITKLTWNSAISLAVSEETPLGLSISPVRSAMKASSKMPRSLQILNILRTFGLILSSLKNLQNIYIISKEIYI
jgi:hypothetical protein